MGSSFLRSYPRPGPARLAYMQCLNSSRDSPIWSGDDNGNRDTRKSPHVRVPEPGRLNKPSASFTACQIRLLTIPCVVHLLEIFPAQATKEFSFPYLT